VIFGTKSAQNMAYFSEFYRYFLCNSNGVKSGNVQGKETQNNFPNLEGVGNKVLGRYFSPPINQHKKHIAPINRPFLITQKQKKRKIICVQRKTTYFLIS
jgi:hypothetical protein